MRQLVSREWHFLLKYKRNIVSAVGWFIVPSLLVRLVVFIVVGLAKRDLGDPVINTGGDYLTILLGAAAIFTALASVQVQILSNLIVRMEDRRRSLSAVRHLFRASQFTRRSAWIFAGGVPPTLILLGLEVSGRNLLGATGMKTFVATLQYGIFVLFAVGWLFLFAASLRGRDDVQEQRAAILRKNPQKKSPGSEKSPGSGLGS